MPVISEVLSHSDTDTTKIYLKVDMYHLRKIALEVPWLTGVWMGGVHILNRFIAVSLQTLYRILSLIKELLVISTKQKLPTLKLSMICAAP